MNKYYILCRNGYHCEMYGLSHQAVIFWIRRTLGLDPILALRLK